MVKITFKKRYQAPKPNGNKTKTTAMAKTVAPKSSAKAEDITRITRHVNMIMDPCNAELGPTAYSGADGIISRFRNVQTIGASAGKTGFIFVFNPSYNAVSAVNVNAADLYAFGSTGGGPGQTFLLNSGATQRAVAACSAVSYTGTELDRSGILYSGVVPASAIGANKRVDEIAMLLQHEHRVSDQLLEIKWSPQTIEEQYWESGATTPANSAERNVLVIIGLGLNPATTSSNFSIVNTLIAEWQPEPGQGLVTTNPSSHDVPAGLEKVRTILQRMGNWWSTAQGVAGAAYKAYNSGAGVALRAAVLAVL